ncbi:hypothetical protein MUP77_05945 [Candidatus Bathyarchaeota archaeon]|nr:hypothetical protein [Candidatus Bathyarchaeota archaeon]
MIRLFTLSQKDTALSFLPETEKELNKSLRYATEWCAERGAEAVLILPVDVPLVTEGDIREMIRLLS